VARPVARQMSFADLELLRQGVRLEPLLQAICDFLDKQPALVERVRRDLVCGLKQPDHGRRGLTAPQVLRALVLMRLKNWDYRELRGTHRRWNNAAGVHQFLLRGGAQA
jgi:IS5 family transposase